MGKNDNHGKRGRNQMRRMRRRAFRFANFLLHAYKAAGHEIADRPVCEGIDGNPIHPDLEAAIKWGYAQRQKHLEARAEGDRRRAEEDCGRAPLVGSIPTVSLSPETPAGIDPSPQPETVASIGSRPNDKPEVEKAQPVGVA